MKINRILVIGLLGCWVIASGGCAKREIKNLSSSGKNIICFGDSITFGYGAAKGDDYPTALGRMVSLPVINLGIDGDTSTDALKRIELDVLSREPFLVIVEFCGNDFIKKVPKETTYKNIREIVERIQRKGALVALVDISAGLFLSEYRAAFKTIAQETGAVFIPEVLRGIVTNPSMKSDFLHPNARGYKLIAQRVHKIISSYLR